MDMDAELLMLAGEDDGDGKPSSPIQVSSPATAPSPGKSKKRARPSTKKPLRKRARHNSDDDEEEQSDTLSEGESSAESLPAPDTSITLESSDEEGAAQLYPLEGKYKNHADKENLMGMTEIERESILAERQAKIDKETQDRHLRRLLKSRKAAENSNGSAPSASTTRKSARMKSAPKATAEATKRGKLDEMRKTREERSRKAGNNVKGDGDEYTGRRRSLVSEDDEDEKGGDEHYAKEDREIALQDINRARFGRTGFSKLLDYPGFEEVAQDCFVRIALWNKEEQRNVYRICQIKGFNTGKPYSLKEGERRIDRYVCCVHGTAERSFPMDVCSDSQFTESEFNRFKRALEADKVPVPTLSTVRRKAEEIRLLSSKQLDPKEFEAVIAKRKKDRFDTVRLAMLRRDLNNKRNLALENGDDNETERLEKELQELEDQYDRPVARAETQMERVARINAENRRRNTLEIRKAEQEERRRAREAAKNGEAFSNPFARVKTKPQFRYPAVGTQNGSTKNGENATESKADATNPLTDGKPNGVGVMGAPKIPKSAYRRGGVDDVIANLDLGIDIEI